MYLRQLQHFLAAVGHGNLTLAAVELGISQPALSKSIRQLERRLKVTLLERGRFGVSPTRFGEALIAHAKLVNAEIKHAESEIEGLRGAKRGHVIMGCGPSEATRLLPLAVTELLKNRPELRITVLYGLNEALMPWVRLGEVDFALSSVPNLAADPDLEHESLYADRASIVARAGHPLAKKQKVSPADLGAYKWVLARRHELERRALDDLFLAHGLLPPEASIETTSSVLMKSVVSESDFLTLLPQDLVYQEVETGVLTALRVGELTWARFVGITRRRRGSVSPAALALIDCLKTSAAQVMAMPKAMRKRR